MEGSTEQLRSDLKDFELHGVREEGRLLGTGSYGRVFEVTYNDTVYAAKELHSVLMASGQSYQGRKFHDECRLLSTLRHPNIVQFIGISFLSNLPVLVMERLQRTLHNFLEISTNAEEIPLTTKCSIMRDVACGLAFLHGQSPPTIHRDLSAANILLSEDKVAKLADFGMARPTDIEMTQLPGSVVYMPPEAAERKYGRPLDVFSYGVVTLFTLTRVFPQNLLKPTYDGSGGLVARSELERRQEYMDILHNDQEIPPKHYLAQMIPQCLQNNPENRPLIQNVLTILELNQKIEQLQQGTDDLRKKTQDAKKDDEKQPQKSDELKFTLAERALDADNTQLKESNSSPSSSACATTDIGQEWQTCTYYYHPVSEEVWAKQTTTDGRRFFCNIATNEKSWRLSGPIEENEIEPLYALDKPIPALLHTSQTRKLVKGRMRRKRDRHRTVAVMFNSEMKWKTRTYFYKPETEEVWLQRVHDGKIYFCNIATNALSWKLPETGVESMSGPDSAEVNVDPIEVLVHRSQIEEYISNRKQVNKPRRTSSLRVPQTQESRKVH